MLTTPPDVVLPWFPPKFFMPDPSEYQGFHPSARELHAAEKAIANLRRFVDYEATFGKGAPARDGIADALALGLAWRDHRGPAERWLAYVKSQDGLAWKQALTLLGELKPSFLLALKRDPSLALRYGALADLFAAPHEVARKSARARKAKAEAKKAEAETPTPER